MEKAKAKLSTLNKTVNLELVGLDGNAFALMGAFQRQAKKEKWTHEEIRVVLDECTAGDYDHLLQTLAKVCEPTGTDGDEVNYDDEEED